MLKVKLLSALTQQHIASILAYAKDAEVVNGELIADLSAAAIIRRICPGMSFSAVDTDPRTCIVHTNLSEEELVAKVGAPVISLGSKLFKAETLPAAVIESLLNDSDIIDIQTNTAEIKLMAFPTLTSVVKPGTTDVHVDLASLTPVSETATGATSDDWSLPRIFNRTLPYDPTIKRFNPIHPALTNVYLMDSGINKNHSEFNNNVQDLFSITGIFDDNVGHGTELASAMIGRTVGVAPEHVNVKNVKIFDAVQATTLEGLVNAFQAISNDVIANPGNHVVNMSWVISKNTIIEQVIQTMMDVLNIKFVCAAGNSGQPIELLTPASMKSVLTVGAIDDTNTICGFTNYSTDPIDPSLPLFEETSVDIFAPGFKCKVANYLDVNAYTLSIGTSVSSAYVAAVAAYTSLLEYPTIVTQQDLFGAMVEYSTKELIVISDPKYALMPNRIVWQLHPCAETNIPDVHNTHYLPPDVSADLTHPPADYATVCRNHEEQVNSIDSTTNYSRWLTTFYRTRIKSIRGVVKSAPVIINHSTDQYSPNDVYVLLNNYFTAVRIITTTSDVAALDISLQYKTTGSGSQCTPSLCGYGFYYAGSTSLCVAQTGSEGIGDPFATSGYVAFTGCCPAYQADKFYAVTTNFTWTNSINNGYIQTMSSCGSQCAISTNYVLCEFGKLNQPCHCNGGTPVQD